MNVAIEEAYAEACTALGESIIRERLLAKQIQAQPETATPASE